MKKLNKRNIVVLSVIALLTLIIGFMLIPVSLIAAIIVVVLAALPLAFVLFLLVRVFVRFVIKSWPTIRTCAFFRFMRSGFWKLLVLLMFIAVIIILFKEHGTVHIGTAIIDKIEVSDVDIGKLEVSDVDIGHIEVSDVDIGELEVSDVDIGHIEASDVDIGELEVSDVDIGHIEASDVDIGELEVSDVDIGHIEASDVDIGNIDTSDADNKNDKDDKDEKPEPPVHVCAVDESKTVTKNATCTEDGYVRKYCSCGKLISEKKLAATGHDYKVVDKQDATSTADGYIIYRCAHCPDSYKEIIPATGSDVPEEPSEFVITVSGGKRVDDATIVVGNEFDAIEVYTSGSVYDLVILQNQTVFNVTIIDEHHLILTVGDFDTYAKVRIYDPAHEDVIAVVIRVSPVDPRA